MDGTILSQGSFVAPATIVNRVVAIPSGVDWMRVVNYTRMGTVGGASAYGNQFLWQRGMSAGTGSVQYYSNGSAILNGDNLLSGGFTLYDPSGNTNGALPLLSASVATTAITNVTRPVVSTGSTAGVAVGTVVRLSTQSGDTQDAQAVCGIDFVVGAVTANVSFTLLTASNALANTVGLTTGTGHYRIVRYDPLFYPYRRYIVNITQAANAQVSTSVAHGLTVGQEVRMIIPAVSGMIELNANPLNNYYPNATSAPVIVASVVDDYNFTINVNTSAYTAFTFPTVAQQPSSFPLVVPVGEDTATSLSSIAAQTPTIGGVQIYNTNSGILADSTVNTGYIGMILGTGGLGAISGAAIGGPAGSVAGDVVYWIAGKSSYGGL